MRLSKNQKLKIIIIIGPPGSGKGTQGELLSEKFKLYYFETSKILEKTFNVSTAGEVAISIEGKKYYFAEEKKLWQEGLLCSPPFVTHLVSEKIKELFKERNSLILAGSPRTIYEGERIIPLLIKLYGKENITVILLKQSPEVSIFRNAHRKICELMRHPMIYAKETDGLKNCPLDGSRLLQREGLDDPETIKVRLQEYEKRTLPLVALFKKQGLNIEKINAEQSVANVFSDILKVL